MMGYDDWKTRTPELYETGTPSDGRCPVCEGGDGVCCSESCEATAKVVRLRGYVRGLYRACERALMLCRKYAEERDALAAAGISTQDARITVAISQVQKYRALISQARSELRAWQKIARGEA